MHMNLSAEDLAFRDHVRTTLDETYTPELRAMNARQAGVFCEPELSRRWHRTLYDLGWVAPAWPKEYGGPGFTPTERYIVQSELALIGAPSISAMGVGLCGPMLMGHGTVEQKARFLPKILSGEHVWCQGYSEPGSGSDLASLQTRAVRDGDDYVINGTKIWTTHAHNADWMFMLVRTSTEGRQQAGITFLLLDMKTPGVSIRPIITIAGEHEVNQVFFDNVRTPVSLRVGEENQGWTVAKYLLEFERGGSGYASQLQGAIARVKRTAMGDEQLAADASFRRRLAELEIEIAAVDMGERRVLSGVTSGKPVGDATASMIKMRGTETLQKVTELAMEALGAYAAPDQRAALSLGSNVSVIGPDDAMLPTARYLNTRASTIYGGSSEVQHNIMARTALGL